MFRRADSAPLDVTVRASGATSPGNRRTRNEDAFVAGPDWFAVADGMGGHLAGDVASALAIQVVTAAGPPSDVDAARATLVEANAAIRDRARRDDAPGMGTTFVGVTAADGPGGPWLLVVHVGDSRCYRLHAGRLTLLTRDHTHVRALVDAGRLAPPDAADHPLRNVLTRALGIDESIEVDVSSIEPSGRLLLCSDGLWGELDDAQIGRVLAGIAHPQSCAERLVELALTGPARDNVTAVVVDVAAAGTGAPGSRA